MIQLKRKLAVAFLAGSALFTGAAYAGNETKMFEVTVTNITQGEIFTPIMVASHRSGVKLFTVGSAASTGLEILAESGDPQPLIDELKATGKVLDVATADNVLPPGKSVTLQVKTNDKNNRVSVVSMLVPTNDAIFAVNGIRGPEKNKKLTVHSPAYDAGTELNDELCASIPGPPFICSGEGYNPDSGEGYVYIHPGIQGVGDLIAANHDWRNPVARIMIRVVQR